MSFIIKPQWDITSHESSKFCFFVQMMQTQIRYNVSRSTFQDGMHHRFEPEIAQSPQTVFSSYISRGLLDACWLGSVNCPVGTVKTLIGLRTTDFKGAFDFALVYTSYKYSLTYMYYKTFCVERPTFEKWWSGHLCLHTCRIAHDRTTV